MTLYRETDRAFATGDRVQMTALDRERHDARIYTDDKGTLARALDRDVSHRSALERTPEQVSR